MCLLPAEWFDSAHHREERLNYRTAELRNGEARSARAGAEAEADQQGCGATRRDKDDEAIGLQEAYRTRCPGPNNDRRETVSETFVSRHEVIARNVRLPQNQPQR